MRSPTLPLFAPSSANGRDATVVVILDGDKVIVTVSTLSPTDTPVRPLKEGVLGLGNCVELILGCVRCRVGYVAPQWERGTY